MYKSLKITAAVLCWVVIMAAGCGINRQARQVRALEDCKYRIAGADQLSLAGIDIKKAIAQRNIEADVLPGLTVGLLTKNIPFKANISLEITNPSTEVAAINQFEYQLLVGDTEIANGFADKGISVAPGKSAVTQLQVNSNLYSLLADKAVLNGVVQAIRQRSGTESLGTLTIKLKPTIMVGKEAFKYPGYITFSKEINSSLFR